MLNTKQICRFALTGVCLAALVVGIVWNVLFAVADLSARRNQTGQYAFGHAPDARKRSVSGTTCR